MAILKVLVTLAVLAVIVNVAVATTYNVGGSNGGWDTSTDLTTWASTQTFSLGDTLVFNYDTMHSVIEVTKADFDSCETSNPLLASTSGFTPIILKSAGKRYFICGSVGHCGMGMKVEVDTLATASSPPPPTPVATPPPVKTTPAPATPSTPPPAKTAPAPVTPSTPPPKKTAPAPKTPSTPRHSKPVAPVSAPTKSPATGYPDVPTSISPAKSPSPSGSLSAPSKSSATKACTLLGSAAGLSFAVLMLLIL